MSLVTHIFYCYTFHTSHHCYTSLLISCILNITLNSYKIFHIIINALHHVIEFNYLLTFTIDTLVPCVYIFSQSIDFHFKVIGSWHYYFNWNTVFSSKQIKSQLGSSISSKLRINARFNIIYMLDFSLSIENYKIWSVTNPG